jgi:hypothetical protein
MQLLTLTLNICVWHAVADINLSQRAFEEAKRADRQAKMKQVGA